MPKTKAGEYLTRRNMLRIGAGLAAAGALLELTGCAPNEKAPAPGTSPVASAPATPGASESTAPTEKWLPAKGDYLSPEQLAKLQTPEEITEAFVIKAADATSPEQLAKLKIYRDQALINMGNDPSELERYSTATEFADAMADNYNQPALDGVYFDPARPNQVAHSDSMVIDHRNANIWAKRSAIYDGAPYGVTKDLDKLSFTGSIEGGAITLTITSTFNDNMPETGIMGKFPDEYRKQGVESMTSHLILLDGKWYITDEKGSFTPTK